MRDGRPLPRALSAVLAFTLAGCESHPVPTDAGPSEPSPNASILPAPLATGPDPTRSAADAGPSDGGLDAEVTPPTPAREDEALPVDGEDLHDTSGVTLRARFRWPDVAATGRLPETNVEALERTRALSTFDLDVSLAAIGRLRITLAASRFVLAANSEFRARSDRFGHVLAWPDGRRYVVIQPGALRTVLNERRTDVVPLAHVTGASRGTSQALGYPTERVQLVSSLGKTVLEQAHIPAAGLGGALLCRFLVELAGVHPDTAVCRAELTPVRAEYNWTEAGSIVFETSTLERTSSLETAALRVPPDNAEHRIGELPVPPSALLLERPQLRSLRLRPAPVRASKDAPKEGLLLVNGDDLFRYALLDGVPVGRLEPRGSGLLLDLLAGTYVVAARTFLGDELVAGTATTVPGRLVIGETPRPEAPVTETDGSGTRAPRPTPARKAD